MHELEGFNFATALDLNMDYYTIRLDPDASKIYTIIFPLGKYSYLRLLMGIAGSPDIFQAKMSELMVALEFVRTYLGDLLCITKASLDDHLHHARLVFTRLQEAGLPANAPKLKFCAIEMEYLGYIEVEGNSPLEDYFCHLSQNGINFLSRQLLLFGLNKNEKSRRGEVIKAPVFDHAPGRLSRKNTTFKDLKSLPFVQESSKLDDSFPNG